MKKIVIVLLSLAFIGTTCYAVEKTPKATEPIGAVIETGGVFIGKIVGGIEKATTGEKKITVKSETGETRVFPFEETVQLVDKTFHGLTFNQLKGGENVSVKYSKKGEKEKIESVTVTK